MFQVIDAMLFLAISHVMAWIAEDHFTHLIYCHRSAHGSFTPANSDALIDGQWSCVLSCCNRSAGRGLFRKGMVRFSHWKPRERRKARDENVK